MPQSRSEQIITGIEPRVFALVGFEFVCLCRLVTSGSFKMLPRLPGAAENLGVVPLMLSDKHLSIERVLAICSGVRQDRVSSASLIMYGRS
jgi:hypothetical protein